MKLHSFLLIMLLGIAFRTHAQTVTNVHFEQVDNQVKITYNLDEEADISVSVSEDRGKTWCVIGQVSGDVGKQVSAGDNKSYWDVLSERKKAHMKIHTVLMCAFNTPDSFCFSFRQKTDYCLRTPRNR